MSRSNIVSSSYFLTSPSTSDIRPQLHILEEINVRGGNCKTSNFYVSLQVNLNMKAHNMVGIIDMKQVIE